MSLLFCVHYTGDLTAATPCAMVGSATRRRGMTMFDPKYCIIAVNSEDFTEMFHVCNVISICGALDFILEKSEIFMASGGWALKMEPLVNHPEYLA